MKLSRLITYLKRIQNVYGDMEIEGNIIGGERMSFTSLCVEDNYAQGFSQLDSGDRYNLLIEFETEDSDYTPLFNCYEYPSNKNICINNESKTGE